jgi:hypothetical protein
MAQYINVNITKFWLGILTLDSSRSSIGRVGFSYFKKMAQKIKNKKKIIAFEVFYPDPLKALVWVLKAYLMGT